MHSIKTREEIIHFLPKNSKGAEIGIFEGNFSEYIIDTVKPSLFYLVDVFTGYTISGDKNGENMKEVSLDLVYENLTNKFKDNNNIKLFKGFSANFYESIPDDALDFIYIDGDHSYEGVKLDINNARNKIKTGGLICGHDYTSRFQGVIDAVDEFCNKHSLTKQITEDGCPSFVITNIK